VNSKQAVAFGLGLALFLLMGLFPPLVEERWSSGGILGLGRARLESHFVGYGYLLNCGVVSVTEGGVESIECNVAWAILLCQWVAVIIATWFAIRKLKGHGQLTDAGHGTKAGEAVLDCGLILGSTLLGVGLLMTIAGSASLFPLTNKQPSGPGCWCVILGVPVLLLGIGICFGRSLGGGGR
jgi:hypothetical protein